MNNIRARTKAMLKDLYDFSDVWIFENGDEREYYLKLTTHYRNRVENLDAFFFGNRLIKGDVSTVILEDFKLGRDLLMKEGQSLTLLPYLDQLIADIEDVRNSH